VHIVGFIIRIYHDARSAEHQKYMNVKNIRKNVKPRRMVVVTNTVHTVGTLVGYIID